MKTLAVDPGSRRIGLAVSDDSGTLATPLKVVDVRSEEHAVEVVAEAARREGCARILVGVPLNMDGTRGPAAQKAIAWGRRLRTVCALPVIFVDERLSSFAAEQHLATRKRAGERITRATRRRRLDALAAAAFLQDYLDGRLPPLMPANDEP